MRFAKIALWTLVAGAVALTASAEPEAYPSAEAVKPLAVGRSVPQVAVRSVVGEPVDLAELVRERGALLVFYRGGW